jgi:hypothetical protein
MPRLYIGYNQNFAGYYKVPGLLVWMFQACSTLRNRRSAGPHNNTGYSPPALTANAGSDGPIAQALAEGKPGLRTPFSRIRGGSGWPPKKASGLYVLQIERHVAAAQRFKRGRIDVADREARRVLHYSSAEMAQPRCPIDRKRFCQSVVSPDHLIGQWTFQIGLKSVNIYAYFFGHLQNARLVLGDPRSVVRDR